MNTFGGGALPLSPGLDGLREQSAGARSRSFLDIPNNYPLLFRTYKCLNFMIKESPPPNSSSRSFIMLSSEAREAVSTELKRIGATLQLSDDQKKQLHTALENARERLDEIRTANPDLTKADVIEKLRSVRGSARERVVKFLTPEQLTKWDAEVGKAKMFLGMNA